ncbi:MAG TPA: hypothetical protein V6D11_24090 [Waterburya sp.]
MRSHFPCFVNPNAIAFLKTHSFCHQAIGDEDERCDRSFSIIQQLANLQTFTKITHFFSPTARSGVGYQLS